MDIKTLAKNHNWNLPTVCPVCGGELELSDNFKQFTCTNEACKSRASGRIFKWTNVLGIKEFGLKTIDKLLDEKIIDSISSLYTTDWDKIADIEGFGKRSAEIIKKELDSHKKMSLAQFVAGYNIASIGEKVIQKIIDAHNISTIEDLRKLNDLTCEGVGEKTAQKLKEGLNSLENDMNYTLLYINLDNKKEVVEVAANSLQGQSFCFTGPAKHTRKELWEMVKANGGVVHESIKKDTDYLVMADVNSTSIKAQKARANGTTLLTEDDFLGFCQL